ncbi:MAG TPA: hypothetical protein VG753_01305 [Candidatus Paceibacterota bacterium]|nr:hypothetical protein [Candidatus Paceibacterota bacterium]
MPDFWGVMSPEDALKLIELAGDYHRGKRKLPPEIIEKKKQIEAAIRNAELFMVHLRVVDQGMVNDIVQMKLDLDALYSNWAQRETVH